MILEKYFPGKDFRWGQPLGDVAHNSDTLHDIRSVTKSITSLLYGIALEEAKVPALDSSLLDAFPEYPDLQNDSLRKTIRISDVLTMQMGTEWNESLPYWNPKNSEHAMELSEDRLFYALSQKMIQRPGQSWVYNGGTTNLIAHLITQGTGMSLDHYAQEKLFSPLSINEYDWIKSKDDNPIAASGLRLKAKDLAKIGLLMLNQGKWQGQQIIPKSWIELSTSPHTLTQEGDMQYGYFWWLSPKEDRSKWFSGFGNGGQRLFVDPDAELVAVIYAGNYDDPEAWQVPVKVLSDYIYPML